MRSVTQDPKAVELSNDLLGSNSRSRARRLWLLVAVGLMIGLVWFALNAGSFLVIDAPQPSDVMVVLAGETNRRPARALQLLQEGYAPRILLDVPAAEKIYDTTLLDLTRAYVSRLAEAQKITVCPIPGLSTREEALDVEKCLQQMSGSRVLIVTSDYHTRRALSILRHAIKGKSFSVAAATDATQFGTHWWAHRQWAKVCLDEWLRLLWWECIERWR
jgi:uncharacterized SAM-binding protein YcdF (DUF218 family)